MQLQVIDSYVTILEAFKSIRLDLTDKIIRFYDFQRNVYSPVHADTKIPLSWISGDNCELVLVKLGTMTRSLTNNSGSVSHEA